MKVYLSLKGYHLRQFWSGLFLAFGFWGIALGVVLGALLGTKNHVAMETQQLSWINGLQRVLLRSAHAHWNSMCVCWILFGLTIPHAFDQHQRKSMSLASSAAILGPLLFVLGLMAQSMLAPNLLWPILLTALGGLVFFTATLYWGSCLWTRKVGNGQ